jgi:hypothetical protein
VGPSDAILTAWSVGAAIDPGLGRESAPPDDLCLDPIPRPRDRACMIRKLRVMHLMPHETTPTSASQSRRRNLTLYHERSSGIALIAIQPCCPYVEYIVRDLPLVRREPSADGTLARIAFLVGYDGDVDGPEHVARLRPVVTDVHVSHPIKRHSWPFWGTIGSKFNVTNFTLRSSAGALFEYDHEVVISRQRIVFRMGKGSVFRDLHTSPLFVSSLLCRDNTTVYAFST